MPSSAPHDSGPRVQRLDPEWAVAAVHAVTGVQLALEMALSGGEVGAVRVRWPDGRPAVLTWAPSRRLADLQRGPLATVAALRARGYPAPQLQLAVEHHDTVITVHELLAGAPPQRMTTGLLDAALALLDRHAAVLTETVPPVRLWLACDGPGFCLHEPPRRFNRRTAAVEKWARGVAAELPDDALPGTDAVHFDFTPANWLASGNVLTGVVDWNGAGRGDRLLDLVTLRFGLLPLACDDGVVQKVDTLLDHVPPEVLRPAWAHMSLRMIDWTIRHHPDTVPAWTELAEQRMH